MRPTPILLTALLSIPIAAASTVAYTDTDTLSPGVAGYSETRRYIVSLNAGETLEAALSWNDPFADLDIDIFGPIPPVRTCEILPDPNAPCLVDIFAGPVLAIPGRDPIVSIWVCDRGVFDGSPTTATRVANATGTYRVTVATAVAPRAVSYDLTLEVDGVDANARVQKDPSKARLIGTDTCPDG